MVAGLFVRSFVCQCIYVFCTHLLLNNESAVLCANWKHPSTFVLPARCNATTVIELEAAVAGKEATAAAVAENGKNNSQRLDTVCKVLAQRLHF